MHVKEDCDETYPHKFKRLLLDYNLPFIHCYAFYVKYVVEENLQNTKYILYTDASENQFSSQKKLHDRCLSFV
jgi:hypothetical protein